MNSQSQPLARLTFHGARTGHGARKGHGARTGALALALATLAGACSDSGGSVGDPPTPDLFTVPAATTLGGAALNVATGDLNLNGRSELIVATATGIEIFSISSAGNLLPFKALDTGGSPFGVHVADLDGNGRQDLIATDRANSELVVYLGKGKGNFKVPRRITTGPNPEQVVSADLDGDGDLDLVVRDTEQRVLLGDGDGNFTELTSFTLGSIRSIAVADLNGNTDLDLIFAGDALEIQLDVTGGSPSSSSHSLIEPVDRVALGDVTGDGVVDAVVLSDRLRVERGNGNGTFTHWQTLSAPADFTGGHLLVASVDDIGAAAVVDPLEIIVSSPIDSTTAVYRSSTSGLNAWDRSVFNTYQPGPIAVARFTNDSTPDLCVAVTGPDQMQLFEGEDAGTIDHFAGPRIYPRPGVAPGGPIEVDLAVVDLSGDGIPDLASIEPSFGVGYLKNDGFGNMLSPQFGINLDTSTYNLKRIVPTDLDQDGLMDLVVLANPAGTANPAVITVRSLGSDLFEVPQYLSLPGSTFEFAVAGELNGDMYPDLVVTRPGQDDIVVLLGTGTGTLSIDASYASVDGVSGLALSYLNPDSVLDLVVTGTGGTAIMIGQTDGSFAAPTNLDPRVPGYALALGEFNGDATEDVLVSDPLQLNNTGLTALITDGAGGFSLPNTTPNSIEAYWIVSTNGDATGDGLRDVLVNDVAQGTVDLFPGAASSISRLPVDPRVTAVGAGDLDLDGDLDLILHHTSGIVVVSQE